MSEVFEGEVKIGTHVVNVQASKGYKDQVWTKFYDDEWNDLFYVQFPVTNGYMAQELSQIYLQAYDRGRKFGRWEKARAIMKELNVE